MALQLESRILWGTGLENVLVFEYPTALDSKRHWRRPAPGSERARNAVGTTDAWVTGYDYMLAGRARWFTDALWSGGPGIQEFLDWAGQGNVFRFVPDKNTPDFYVDNVTLDEPFDDPAPDLEQADGSQAIDLVLRNPTMDFGLALRGIMFQYAPGKSLVDPVAATFSRAAAAEYTDLTLGMKSAATNVLRDTFNYLGQRVAMIEPTNNRANCLKDSEDPTTGNWTNTGPPTIALNSYVLNDIHLALISDTDGTLRHLHQSIPAGTFSGGSGIKAIGFFAKKPRSDQSGAAFFEFALYDETASAHRYSGTVSWNTDGTVSAFSVTIGTSIGYYHVGEGIYCFLGLTTSGTLNANQNGLYMYPAGSTAANVGSVLFGCVWIVDNISTRPAVPGSYTKSTGSALGPRVADRLEFNHYAWPPQDEWHYLKFLNTDPLLVGDYTQFFGARQASGANGWRIYAENSVPRKFTFSLGAIGGVLPESSSVPAHGAVAHGDIVELLCRVIRSGAFNAQAKCLISINGAADVVGPTGSVILLPKWDDPGIVQVGISSGAGAAADVNLPLIAYRRGAGAAVTTIAQARAV